MWVNLSGMFEHYLGYCLKFQLWTAEKAVLKLCLSSSLNGDVAAWANVHETWLIKPKKGPAPVMFVRDRNSLMLSSRFSVGLYHVEPISKPANIISSFVKWNLSGLKTIPLSAQSLKYLTVCQNESTSSSHKIESSTQCATQGKISAPFCDKCGGVVCLFGKKYAVTLIPGIKKFSSFQEALYWWSWMGRVYGAHLPSCGYMQVK